MTITQQPDAYSLTSTIKDIILSSDSDITFEALADGTTSILEEIYSPDSDGKIYIRDLGKLIENYLSGSMASGLQSSISCNFVFLINRDEDDEQTITTSVLLCKAYTTQDTSAFFTGHNPLHLQYGTKVTIPTAREYLTFYMVANAAVKVKVIYLDVKSFKESDLLTYDSVQEAAGFYTFEITLAKVVALFPDIDPENIVSYLVGVGDIYSQFSVDWNTYQDTKMFRYLNSFGCPVTLITKGEIIRKRELSYESSKIHRIEKRYDIRRTDTFEVSTGRKFSRVDEALLAEMAVSDICQVYYKGAFCEIIVTQENSEEKQRKGAISAGKFTFRFADERFNIILYDPFWILENGTWKDTGVWFDDGEWLDSSGSGSSESGL